MKAVKLALDASRLIERLVWRSSNERSLLARHSRALGAKFESSTTSAAYEAADFGPHRVHLLGLSLSTLPFELLPAELETVKAAELSLAARSS